KITQHLGSEHARFVTFCHKSMPICSESLSKRFLQAPPLVPFTPARLACLALIGWLGFIAVPSAHPKALPSPTGPVLLVVSGVIKNTNAGGEAHFDADMLESLPQHTLHTSTAVTDGVNRFDGVLVRDVLNVVEARGA